MYGIRYQPIIIYNECEKFVIELNEKNKLHAYSEQLI